MKKWMVLVCYYPGAQTRQFLDGMCKGCIQFIKKDGYWKIFKVHKVGGNQSLDYLYFLG